MKLSSVCIVADFILEQTHELELLSQISMQSQLHTQLKINQVGTLFKNCWPWFQWSGNCQCKMNTTRIGPLVVGSYSSTALKWQAICRVFPQMELWLSKIFLVSKLDGQNLANDTPSKMWLHYPMRWRLQNKTAKWFC